MAVLMLIMGGYPQICIFPWGDSPEGLPIGCLTLSIGVWVYDSH